jgi:hypothetical protein
MTHHRIAVALDESAPALAALAWAVREAACRNATVLVITAWPAAQRRAARDGGTLVAARIRLCDMQRDAILAATVGLDPIPTIAREVILAEPVTALRHAATRADLIVVGGDETTGPSRWSNAARIKPRVPARHPVGVPVPTVVVTTSPARPAPSVPDDPARRSHRQTAATA